ncbi:MAG: DUF1840 domain-containing protein [Burkholderiales bacterium]
MIYKFKSRATGDLIMLEADGRQMLEIIGKHAGPQGIILPDEMEEAVTKLRAAIDRAEKQPPAEAAPKPPRTDGYGEVPAERDVTLRQRAVPFIDMLHECKAAGKEIVWGV